MKHLLLSLGFCIFSLCVNGNINKEFSYSLVDEDPMPFLMITSPTEGQKFTTEEIMANFRISNIPLDGSYELDVWLEFGISWTTMDIWHRYLPDWHGVETKFSIPITEERPSITFKILENLEYILHAAIHEIGGVPENDDIIDNSSVNFEVELPEVGEKYIVSPKTPCGTVTSDPIDVEMTILDTDDYYVLENYHRWGTEDEMMYTSYPDKGISSVIEKPGKYYCLYVVKVEGYNVYTELCEYEITDPTGINDNLSETDYYINDRILYISSAQGDKIDVYTLEGLKLYSSVASGNTTSISGLKNNQILLVKVGNYVSKVLIK